jgi:hypothetical protein
MYVAASACWVALMGGCLGSSQEIRPATTPSQAATIAFSVRRSEGRLLETFRASAEISDYAGGCVRGWRSYIDDGRIRRGTVEVGDGIQRTKFEVPTDRHVYLRVRTWTCDRSFGFRPDAGATYDLRLAVEFHKLAGFLVGPTVCSLELNDAKGEPIAVHDHATCLE